MKTAMVRWNCDLCGRRDETNHHQDPPNGWTQIAWEDPQLDRSFIAKALCDRCTTLVVASQKRAWEEALAKHLDRLVKELRSAFKKV